MPSEKVWYWPKRNIIFISWCMEMYWEFELGNYITDIIDVYKKEFVLLGEL